MSLSLLTTGEHASIKISNQEFGGSSTIHFSKYFNMGV